MPITIQRVWESPVYNGADGLSIDVVYLIIGTDDDTAAYSALRTTSGIQIYNSAPAAGWKLNERRGHELYAGTITYTIEPYESGYEYSFSTKGQTTKITQAIATIASGAVSGSAPNVGNAIGITKDGIEGCEIITPTFSWQETHVYPLASINESVLVALAQLTGTVNADAFRTFAAGEVRFDGVDGRRLSPTKFAIDYSFSASPNATGLTVGSMTGISKKGWEYLWVLYNEVTSNDRVVKQPVAYFVQQVYRYLNFSTLGL